MSNNEWQERYDELDWQQPIHIENRSLDIKVLKWIFESEKREWAPKSMKGLWFDAYKWRTFRQTCLTSTPFLLLSNDIPYYIDASEGKFKWAIPTPENAPKIVGIVKGTKEDNGIPMKKIWEAIRKAFPEDFHGSAPTKDDWDDGWDEKGR